MGPVLRYALLRLGLFAAVVVVLYLLGGRGILLIALAAVISLPLSLLLLRTQRNAMSAAVDERVARRRAGTSHRPSDPDAEAEDAEDDDQGDPPAR